jgi:glycerol-3-phosphate cytidylyltransferase
MTKTVYAGGTFDTPHLGHVNFLQQAAEYGELVVSLNTDKFIKEYKGQAPLYSYEERKEMLEYLGCVARVVPNTGGADSKQQIELVKPDIIAIGSDWATKDYYGQMGFTQDWLDERGIHLIYIPYSRAISTTDIKRRIRERDSRSDD